MFSIRMKTRPRIAPYLQALLLLPLSWLLALGQFAHGQAQVPVQAAPLSPHALLQIQGLMQEKAGRTPAQRKLDSSLLYALKMSRHEQIATGVPTLETTIVADAQGRVLVEMEAVIDAALLTEIRKMGGQIVNSLPAYGSLRAQVPLASLERLAGLASVQFVGRPSIPITNSKYEGDITHRANTARAAFAVSGAGVKVGVLSDSVDFLAAAQASGDLGNVTVLSGQSGVPGTGEGTAMLEIVHSLAPGATLYFATASGGKAQFAANIRALRSAGCDIIVDDVGYSDEAAFQDDVVAQAINDVRANGCLYFTSAGNSGNKDSGNASAWEGDFVNSGVSAPAGSNGGILHSFGGTNFVSVTALGFPAKSNVASLFWSDAIGRATSDYDLVVTDSAGANVRTAATSGIGAGRVPVETLDSLKAGDRIYIVLYSGSPRYLHLDGGRAQISITTPGRIKGHAGTASAVTVGAVDVHTSSPFPSAFVGGSSNPLETFSSDGPRRIFFNPDGSAVTPGNFSSSGGTVVPKPEIAAADGVTTTVSLSGGSFAFYGTSAAAPHAAAIAALIKSYKPLLSPAQIQVAMTSTALDIQSPGFDRDSGYGIVMAYEALLSLGTPTPVLTSLSPSSQNVGSAAFTLTVTGNFFVNGATVKWNDSPRTTTFLSTTGLTAQITAADLATAGTARITVSNPTPGGTSNTLLFSVNNSASSLTSVSPTAAMVGGPGLTLSLTGNFFLPSSTALWNNSARPSAYVSKTQMTAQLSAPDLSVPGIYTVAVTNPPPGGGGSGIKLFTVAQVMAWGDDYFFELGTSIVGLNFSTLPVAVNDSVNNASGAAPLKDVLLLAAGGFHTLAAKTDGTVWAWGDNTYGQLGTQTANASLPLQVSWSSSVTALAFACGSQHSLGLASNNTVYAWGNNTLGQLGLGSTTATGQPTQITGLTGVVGVAAGSHSLAVKSDGTVWAWGNNGSGQLGFGTTDSAAHKTPVQIAGFTGVSSLSANGSCSMALKSNGTVWTWGSNASGQLGDGTTSQRSSPVQVSGLTGVTQVAMGGSHAMALKSDGTVWVWGSNANGQLGNGTTDSTNHTSPVQVSQISGVKMIAAGTNFCLALKTDGTVWGWGANDKGQIGNNSTTTVTLPVQVAGVANVAIIGAGVFHSVAMPSPYPAPTLLALSPNTTVAGGPTFMLTAVGLNFRNGASVNWNGTVRPTTFVSTTQLTAQISAADIAAVGTATVTVTNPNPVVATSTGLPFTITAPGPFITAVRPGYTTVGGPAFTMTIYGGNYVNGSTVTWNGLPRPTTFLNTNALTAAISAQDIASSGSAQIAVVNPYPAGKSNSINFPILNSSGQLYTWGANYNGQLGFGTSDTSTHTLPVLVPGMTGITSLSGGGEYGLAVLADGTARGWGQNTGSQLGDGTTVIRSAPVSVSGLSGAVAVAASRTTTSLALKADGTVWAWGSPNTSGQLGNGTTNASPVPVAVSGLTNVVSVVSGGSTSMALKADGTVWTWGSNSVGQLGQGGSDTAVHATPIQVPGLAGVVQIAGNSATFYALRYDGTLVSWGSNSSGQLGQGTTDTTAHGTPTQITALSAITSIAAGTNYGMALRSDGTVWAWGENSSSQLGDGTNSSRNVPVQVTGLAGAVAIAAGGETGPSLALLSDGTVWSWGGNSFGQLGDGTVNIRSTPVPVSGLANVALIASGYLVGMAVVLPPDPAPTLSGLFLAPSSVFGGGSSQATVTLTGPAQNLGVTVSLSSSSPVASLPSTVMIPPGATSATFTITTTIPTTRQNVTITAAVGTTTKTATLTILTMPNGDFNRDGSADLVFQHSTSRQVVLWYLNGLTVAGGDIVSQIPAVGWQVVGAGDFNRDGKPDLVFQNQTTNQIVLWYLNGLAVTGGDTIAYVPAPGYRVVGVGDFNGDGNPDLVFQNASTGQIAIWLMSGATIQGAVSVPATVASGWNMVGVGDFNGDGKPDLVFQNQSTRQIALWYMNGTNFLGGVLVPLVPVTNWLVRGIGDFNGDGQTDFVFQNSATNQASIWFMSGVQFLGGGLTSVTPAAGYQVVGPK